MARVSRDHQLAQRIIQKSVELWPEVQEGKTISLDEAVEKLNAQLMLAGARMGLIRVIHWPEHGEALEDMTYAEDSLNAFWERFGPHINAILNNRDGGDDDDCKAQDSGTC
jgi:hypothetical protein